MESNQEEACEITNEKNIQAQIEEIIRKQQEKIKQFSDQNNQMLIQQSESFKKISNLEQLLKDSQESENFQRQKNEILAQKNDDLSQQVEESNQKIQEIENQLRQADDLNKDLQYKIKQLEVDSKQSNMNINTHTDQIKDDKIYQLEQQINHLQDKNEELRKSLDKENQKFFEQEIKYKKEYDELKKKMEDTINEIKQDNHQLTNKISDLETQLEDFQKYVSELKIKSQEELHQIMSQIQNYQLIIQQLPEKTVESSPSKQLNDEIEKFQDKKDKELIIQLIQRITQIKPIITNIYPIDNPIILQNMDIRQILTQHMKEINQNGFNQKHLLSQKDNWISKTSELIDEINKYGSQFSLKYVLGNR